jgi:secreted PhoX family phosphatase
MGVVEMDRVSRRALLRGGAGAMAGAAVLGGPFKGFVALAEGAARRAPDFRNLRPIPDLRDGQVRLWLPAGFQYRSFHDTEFPVTLTDGTALPGRHDGMAAFAGPNGNVLLIRNHEVNNPVAAAFGPGTPYDTRAGGGTTTTEVTHFGEVVNAFTSLNGTQMNCSGGQMPWGSWISCEETVNGPDVGPDFTGVSNIPLTQRHGFIFEVPAGDVTTGQSDRKPITRAGRFAHEAAACDPKDGIIYLTEDNFGFPSGLYRYIPRSHPMAAGRIDNLGRLQMLAVDGVATADLAVTQPDNAQFRVTWVDIDDPDPTFPFTPGQTAPTTNDTALQHVGRQGFAQGAAGFSRLEGAVYDNNVIYFCSTQGGGPAEPGPSDTVQGWGNGSGQIWGYHTRSEMLRLVYQSPGPDTLDFPDNVTTRGRRNTLVLCEDNVNDNFLRGLTHSGHLFDIALNRLVSSSGANRFNDEFAGATFSPDGETLFVNIQASRGMTFAIWGPWDRLGV